MDSVNRALNHLKRDAREGDHTPLAFEDFVRQLVKHPRRHIRNVFQLFHDMVKYYVREEADEYPDDPESIHYLFYDCAPLFVADADHPFFADRLFANRLINLAEAFRRGAQQNKIYIFEGPHGCGKSTFLNNLLQKFERFVNTSEGTLYETVWRLDRRVLGSFAENQKDRFLDRLSHLLDTYELGEAELDLIMKGAEGNPLYLEELVNAFADSAGAQRGHTDFARHLMPILARRRRTFAYDFSTNWVPGLRPWEERAYWRDVGTLEAYRDALRDVGGGWPRLELHKPEWPIYGVRPRLTLARGSRRVRQAQERSPDGLGPLSGHVNPT